MKNNLILGLLNYYSFYDVNKFILSLKKTSYHGDVVIFMGNGISPLSRHFFKKHGIKALYFSNIDVLPDNNEAKRLFGFVSPTTHNNYRYYLYYDFLKSNLDKYDKVLLTDVKDVLFQEDPFNFSLKKELCFVLEGKSKTIGDDVIYNGPWIRTIYGEQGLERVRTNYISCCGTVFGTTKAVLGYLENMLQEMGKLKNASITLDQGIHNYLLYTGCFENYQLVSNDEGFVLTVSNEQNYYIDTKGIIRKLDGTPYSVVHQFDRIKELIRFTDARYRGNLLIKHFWKLIFTIDQLLHRVLLKAGLAVNL